MDKIKGMAKGGWHPPGDKAIHRDSWKSDLKGMATNRKKDPYEEQRNHQSAPLTSLKDPDSFGPPPKHSQWYGTNGAPVSPAGSSASGGGLGSAVRTPARIPTREQQAAQEEEQKPKPSGPYRADTTGLSTTNLPKPPVRRADGTSPAPPPRSAASPPVPARQAQPQATRVAPAPVLPPRQNEHPDEYTPPPPPTYQEATVQPAVQAPPYPQAQAAPQNSATINGVAVNRLAQAGVNVPGFGIGGNTASQATPPQSPSTQGHPSQLSELQQRFSRMGTGAASAGQTSPPPSPASTNMAAAAQKKPPPPPPPKKAGLGGNRPGSAEGGATGAAPPPLPLSSKPRPS